MSTQNSVLLNAMLGQMLGTTVNLSVLDWQALSNANVNLLDMLQILQGQASLSTPQSALNSSFTVAQILNAQAAALQTRGNVAAANAIAKVAILAPTSLIKLSDLLSLCLQCTDFSTVNINALDFLSGTVSLYNYQNMLSTPSPISLTGVALGQSSIASVQLYAQVLEPPVIVCGPAGTQFHGAAIRIKLDLNLASVDLTNALNSLGLSLPVGVANLNVQLTHLTVYATIARAQGTIQTVNAINSAVTVQAIPGVVDLYVGTMDDSVFFTRSHTVSASDLSPGVIGQLTVTLLGINVTAGVYGKSAAEADSPFNSTLNFSGAFPQTQTASTSSLVINDLVASILSNLQLSVAVTSPTSLGTTVTNLLNSLLSVISSGLNIVFKAALSPILSPILTGVVDPLLQLLGIQIGQADVTVLGAKRTCTYTVSGYVYKDANRNGFIDNSEPGTGLTLYAKLIGSAAPSTALQAVAVNATTGAYSFTTVSSGTYQIVIDDNATLTDVTATVVPIGWTVGQPGSLTRSSVLVNIADLPNQNFGLIAATLLTGQVFVDDGKNAGTANDGSVNGGEIGLPGATLSLLNSSGTVLDSSISNASGQYQLYIPSTVMVGTALRIVQSRPSGEIATGASVGTTSGTYTRSTDTIAFAFATVSNYSGANFGDIGAPQLLTDGQQNSPAGTTVYYTHKYIASTAGSVTFTTAFSPSNATDVWSSMLYLDTNANGQIDAGESPINGSVNVIAGQTLTLILKVAIPSTAQAGARAQATLQASLAASGASPALILSQSRSDLTIVETQNEAGLVLVKNVDKTTAKPGDTLTYTIVYANRGAGALQQCIIYDATPSFTHFVSASSGPLPIGLTNVTVSAPPMGGTGNIQWTFSGVLNPGSTGTVTFSVTVDQ